MKSVFILLLLAVAMAVPARGVPALANGIAVIVNEKVITYKDVQQLIRDDIDMLERRYAAQPKVLEEKLKLLQEERIEELVENQLVLHEFNTGGFNLPESFIENRINEDIKKYGDRLTLTKTLQAEGITYEAYRKKIRERTIMEIMWRQKVPNDPLISPTKIESFYVENRDKFKLEDQVKLRMIVLTNQPAGAPFSSVTLAREIVKKIDEGAPFAEMARVYSQGSQAQEGGDWGWVQKSVLREDLGKIAFALKPGKRSEVVEASHGTYVMLVEEAKVSHIRSLGEVRDEIEQTLRTQETRRLRQQWIERLKKKSFVRYF